MPVIGHHQLLMGRNSGAVACSLESEYSGGPSFPTEITVQLGSQTGLVRLEFATSSRPDKFEVWIGGSKVIDTGYVGDTSRQSELDAALAALSLPPEVITQRSGNNSTVAADWASPLTRDRAFFLKSVPNSFAVVKVFAPLASTAWRFSLECPDIYQYEIFTESGTFNVPEDVSEVEVLCVAGGGGGHYGVATALQPGGGGGAGGVLYSGSESVTPGGTVAVTVGAGGAGGIGSSSTAATNGSHSVFGSLIAVGGGRGGNASNLPGDGGSGGGGTVTTAGGLGTSGQGQNGSQGTTNVAPYSSGAGGGYRSAGAAGTATIGSAQGGSGETLDYWGLLNALYYGAKIAIAGGGGGGNRANSARAANPGGLGGGGNSGAIVAGPTVTSGQNGVANTGGGGGGPANAETSPASNGGSGGSGIVIVRWLPGSVIPEEMDLMFLDELEEGGSLELEDGDVLET